MKRVLVENKNKTKLTANDRIEKLNNSNIKKHFRVSTMKIPKSYQRSSIIDDYDDDNVKQKLNKYVKNLYKRTNENYRQTPQIMLSLLEDESIYLDEVIQSLEEKPKKFLKDRISLELRDIMKEHKDVNINIIKKFVR